MVSTRSQKIQNQRIERIREDEVLKKKFGIVECHLNLNRLKEHDIRKRTSKKYMLPTLTLKNGNVRERSNVSWLPIATTPDQALSTLAAHQKRDEVLPLRKRVYIFIDIYQYLQFFFKKKSSF